MGSPAVWGQGDLAVSEVEVTITKTYSGCGVPIPFEEGGDHEIGIARQHLLPEREGKNICVLGVGNGDGKGQKVPRTLPRDTER